MALKEKQLELLVQIILEDDTDSDNAADYCDSMRGIIYNFEDDNEVELTGKDAKAVFKKCMATFNDPQQNAAYPIGFIRGLRDALQLDVKIRLVL